MGFKNKTKQTLWTLDFYSGIGKFSSFKTFPKLPSFVSKANFPALMFQRAFLDARTKKNIDCGAPLEK